MCVTVIASIGRKKVLTFSFLAVVDMLELHRSAWLLRSIAGPVGGASTLTAVL
jgi:hypothetical protein